MTNNTLSLDELRESANAKYASLEVDLGDGRKAVLVNALQLPKDERAALVSIQGRLDEENADQVAILQEALAVAGSTTPHETDALIQAVGDNLAFLMELFVRYSRGTQAGEA